MMQFYTLAGSTVTAKGLFQSTLDASSLHPFGCKVDSGNAGDPPYCGMRMEIGMLLSSPNLCLIARNVRLWYAMLCDDWEKMSGDATRLCSDVSKIKDKGLLKRNLKEMDGVCPKPKARRRVDTKKGDYMCVLDNFKNYEINKTTFK